MELELRWESRHIDDSKEKMKNIKYRNLNYLLKLSKISFLQERNKRKPN